MLKNSFSLEVETLTSSTKVYLKMREFGSFPSTSGLPSLRIRVREGTTFLHTGHQRREFLLCELGEWTVALDLRRGRITSLSPRPIFALSWYSLHTYGVTASTEFIFSVGICALLSLGKISSLCVMCVCVCVCAVVFSSVLVTAVQATDISCFTVNPNSVPTYCRWSLFLPSSSTNYMPCLCNCNYFTRNCRTYVISLLKYSQKNSRNKPGEAASTSCFWTGMLYRAFHHLKHPGADELLA